MSDIQQHDARLALLSVIGQLKDQQRIFFESNGIVSFTAAQINAIETATALRPNFQLDPTKGYSHSDPVLEYNTLKLRDLGDLIGIALGLCKPVYERMVDTGEINPQDVTYLDFILYLLNHPS
jgi:hypothetical protein